MIAPAMVLLFCSWFCRISYVELLALDLRGSSVLRFHSEVVNFPSSGYDGLVGFNVVPSSLPVLSFVDTRYCVVIDCLMDCTTSPIRLRSDWFSHLCSVLLSDLCPSFFLALFFAYSPCYDWWFSF